MTGDDTWTPPTEAELKVYEARRERMDKISKIMGDYLLKGYKMLSDLCDVCETILMEDRQGNTYCIACCEVDTTENVKDNPVFSEAAARRLVEESQYATESRDSNVVNDRHPSPPSAPLHQCTSSALPQSNSLPPKETDCAPALPEKRPRRTTDEEGDHLDVDSTLRSVRNKMTWASRELEGCQSIEVCIQLCNLIKACAETMVTLGKTKHGACTVE
ncbi:protein ZNRD2-like [Ornithodoros turicata]|uniref:protein ZNRD2-like n=1 Tax=Ornithodoros turicata TaxID=34597 RepID=UPI003139A3AC